LLEAGVEYHARLIQIQENRVHFYPKGEGAPTTFRLLHDAFLVGKEITYHADGKNITCLPSHDQLILVVEKWMDEDLADRIVIK